MYVFRNVHAYKHVHVPISYFKTCIHYCYKSIHSLLPCVLALCFAGLLQVDVYPQDFLLFQPYKNAQQPSENNWFYKSSDGFRFRNLEIRKNPLKPSVHYMYHTVVTICTASLTFNNSVFCPHSVFTCFVWISEQTAIISLYSINWLVFITETECVYCAVRTGSLYIILRSAHTVYLCVLCGSENKQRLFTYTTLTDWFL